jgi:polyhydroxybutyrate depolymerase
VYVPSLKNGARPAGLVLVFHGGGGTGAGMERLCGMDVAAERYGFIVVYPDGLNRQWNDGRANAPASDDTGFVSSLIDKLTGEYHIDPRHVYATGLSNGGFFAQHLACTLPDKIAAIASVAASVPADASCAAGRAIPVLFFLGTRDPLVPYEGGDIRVGRLGIGGKVLSAADSVAWWVRHNECQTTPLAQYHKDFAGGLGIDFAAYSSTAVPNAVVVYTVQGGGHTWPGGEQYLPAAIVGRTIRLLNANDIIWKFFIKHPLQPHWLTPTH